MLDLYRDAGEPETIAFWKDIYIPDGFHVINGELDILQIERHRNEKFGRVGLDLTIADQEDPTEIAPDDPRNEHLTALRADTISTGHLAASLFGLPKVETITEPDVYERMQFLHVWYGAGGNLYGDQNHRK